jgi:hypothetical protein
MLLRAAAAHARALPARPLLSAFAPSLEAWVAARRERAAAVDPSKPAYVLSDDYSAGPTKARVAETFAAVKAELLPLPAELRAAGAAAPDASSLARACAPDAQAALCRELAVARGFALPEHQAPGAVQARVEYSAQLPRAAQAVWRKMRLATAVPRPLYHDSSADLSVTSSGRSPITRSCPPRAAGPRRRSPSAPRGAPPRARGRRAA